MGFLDRRAGQFRQVADGVPPADRYAKRRGTKDPLYDPMSPRPSNADPVGRAAVGHARPELTALLGRTVLEARTQQICREYGLIPRSGATAGSGLSRSYLARDAGVEIAADTHGVVTTVFLHFHGDDGFASYRGVIPGGAGSVPRRASLWSELGRPGESGDPSREKFLGEYGPWDRWLLPGLALHAQYALDGESLHRVTLTLPDQG